MHLSDFVSIGDRLPCEGQEVEVFRVFGLVGNPCHSHYGCTCGIERTTFSSGIFLCDAATTGSVTHWKRAESWPVASGDDYPGLRDLIPK